GHTEQKRHGDPYHQRPPGGRTITIQRRGRGICCPRVGRQDGRYGQWCSRLECKQSELIDFVYNLWLTSIREHAPCGFCEGAMAEWLCSGLQIRVRRFDSGLRLQIKSARHCAGFFAPLVPDLLSVSNDT